MYAYGTFYDRVGDERVKVKFNDDEVKALVKANKAGEDEYEKACEDFSEKHFGSICISVATSGLCMHIANEGKATGTFVSDEEEWLIAYGTNEAKVKKAYAKAQEAFGGDDEADWEE